MAQTIQYSYDSLHRLVEARYPDRLVRYTYDAAGNRTQLLVELPNPLSVVAGISPDKRVAGAAGFTLQVNGSLFVAGAVVQWNGSAKPTVFVSESVLTATIAPGDLTTAGQALVRVVNPAPGGGASNEVSFTITSAAATPEVSWAAPAPITVGTALSAIQLNATANIEGGFVYAPAAGTTLPVGTHTLSVTFTPTDTVNYTVASKSVSIDVVRVDGPTGVRYDFTGDLKSDILWRHVIQGDIWLWPMDGLVRTAETYVRTISDLNWEIRAIADFDGDSKADIFWRNKVSGQLYYWPMDGATPQDEIYVTTVDAAYDIVGTGDFNGDGKSDLLWRHTTLGDIWIWLMNGATPLSQTYVDTVDPAYVVKGVADLDNNTKADIVFHHQTLGEVWVWPMNGATRLSQDWVGTVPDTGYQIVGVADHTGEGKADLLWHHTTLGEVWIWTMNGPVRMAETWVGTVPDTGYQIVGSGDYDGDGMADILWRHATLGEVWVWLMDGTTKLSETWVGTVPDTGYQIVKVK